METTIMPAAYSGSIPESYDRQLGQLLLEPFAENIAWRVLTAVPRTVLELACGTGRLTRYLVDLLTDTVQIIATDINADMLAYAQMVLASSGAVSWQLADAQALPFTDERFEAVVCQFGAMFFEDRTAAFAEVWRVLEPGGIFWFNTWDELMRNPPVQIAQALLEEAFPTDPPRFYCLPFGYHDEKAIVQELRQCGFVDIHIDTVSKRGYSPLAEEAATGLLEGTPVHTQILQRDAALLPPLKQELARRLAREYGHCHLEPRLQAKVVRGVKPR